MAAVSLITNLRHPSIRLEANPFSGSKFQAQCIAMPNSNAQLFSKARNIINSRNLNDMRTSAMRLPLLPYEVPGENAIQLIDLYQYFFRHRIVFITEALNDDFCNQLMASMLYLDTKDDASAIEYYISCPGGEVNPGLALYDAMHDMASPAATVAVGRSSGVGSLLIAGGEKGLRHGFAQMYLILESPSATAYGQTDGVANEAEELRRVSDYFVSEFAKITGQPLEKITSDLIDSRSFKAKDAIEYGLIDHLVRPAKELEAKKKKKAKKDDGFL